MAEPITDLAEAVAKAVAAPAQRITIGPSPTFGGAKVPVLLPTLVEQTSAEALTFNSVDVTASGSAAVVAAGALKPNAATIAVTPRTIPKIAALANLDIENYWQSTSVISAVLATLFASIFTEADKITNDGFATAVGPGTPSVDWVSAIAGGQAAVNAAGGSPNLIYLPATAWPALVAEISSSSGLSTPSGDVVLSLLGSRIVLSPKGVNAFVLDPAAAIHAVRDVGFILDPLSKSDTNVVRVVAESAEATFVQQPAWIAPISVTTTP